MAKFKAGIPDTFDIKVEPVSDLGDYLDEPRPIPRPKRAAAPTSQTASSVAPQLIPIAPRVDTFETGSLSRNYQPEQPAITQIPVANVDVQERVVGQGRGVVTSSPPVVTATTVEPTPVAQEIVRPKRPKAPRREISMSPETLDMIDELLELIQEGSGQRDAKVNELMHALVALAYEVKDGIEAYSIPKRGRWGTPTARAFPYEIKNAILKAVISKNGNS